LARATPPAASSFAGPISEIPRFARKERAVSTKKKCNIPADKQALYDKLLRTNPKIERKGAANPYTSLNGHMFTYLNPSGTLALRLPEKEREEFLEKYRTTLFEAYGAVMKEYVTVPDSFLKNTKELRKYLDMSYGYLKTLKPKPTKKKS
jgi:hypothetical protein